MTLPGHHQPYWEHDSLELAYPPLAGDMDLDVVVVGGGITGLTAALQLQEAGRRVLLLEMTRIGGGTTGHSTGHLDGTSDQSFQTVLSKFGAEKARTIFAAKQAAIAHIAERVRTLDLACDFRRVPAYLYTETESKLSYLEQELAAAEKLGVAAHAATGAPLPFATRRALRFPDQARFQPLAYVRGLAAAFVARGGRICEDTRAEEIEEKNEQVRVATNRGLVTAQAAVLAGHTPLLGKVTLQSRAYPYQSYVLGVRVAERIDDALFWDTDEPYHYTRIAASDDPELLIIGGADHPTGETPTPQAPFEQLAEYVRGRYTIRAFEHRWSHEFFETADGMPFIGRAPNYRHVFVGAGYSGDGLTFGTVGGLLMADLALGRDNEWEDVFSPQRVKPLASAKRLTSGMIHIARHFVGDRLGKGDVERLEDIPADEGRLIVLEGERLAVYRDVMGNLHALSPKCQHMGCIVQWNGAEKTWDCPCHGGRYDARGNVIMGPPKMALAPAELPQATSGGAK